MAFILLDDGLAANITPADLTVDQADIVLLLQTLGELATTGKLSTTTPDRATCDRLGRLMGPYVRDVTVEQLGAAFAAVPDDIIRVLRMVLLFVLYGDKPT
jgi:hypothetical protein